MTDRLDRLRLQLVATEMSRRVGGNIRRLREAAGLGTQRELADLLPPAVTNQHISNWERGVNQPSPRYLEQLAQALNADVSDFYAAEENGDAKEETPDPFAGQDKAQLDRIEEQLVANARALEVLLGGLANGGAAEEPALARALDHLRQLRQHAEAQRRTA